MTQRYAIWYCYSKGGGVQVTRRPSTPAALCTALSARVLPHVAHCSSYPCRQYIEFWRRVLEGVMELKSAEHRSKPGPRTARLSCKLERHGTGKAFDKNTEGPRTDSRSRHVGLLRSRTDSGGNLLQAWARLGPLSIMRFLRSARYRRIDRDSFRRDRSPKMGRLGGLPTGRPWDYAVPDPIA